MPLHLSTVLARSPTALQAHISKISKTYGNQNLNIAFALSANIPEHAGLSNLVESLTKINPIHGETVGCLSSAMTGIKSTDGSIMSDLFSCSFAVFEASRAQVFESTIPGKVTPQVGRWHSFRDKDSSQLVDEPTYRDGVSWENVWDQSANTYPLPEQLQNLDPENIEAIVYFSDLTPEGLSNSLRSLNRTTKLGLLATSTPFITGRPVTLFRNKRILESGAVGLALERAKAGKLEAHVEFSNAVQISQPMNVTRCEGNMINTINESNPTQLLLSSIKGSGLDMGVSELLKEEERFSIGVLTPTGQIYKTYRITAGDPSRGSLSLDSERAPIASTSIAFLHHPRTTPISLPDYLQKPPSSSSKKTLGFLTVPDVLPQAHSQEREDFEIIMESTFLVASENGFTFSRAAPDSVNQSEYEDTWRNSIPGGLGILKWA